MKINLTNVLMLVTILLFIILIVKETRRDSFGSGIASSKGLPCNQLTSKTCSTNKSCVWIPQQNQCLPIKV